jgi:signal peptidase I
VRDTLKFIGALIIAFLIMLLFRALIFTIYTVPGSSLEPVFKPGDRVLVNRWSYGLRTGGGSLFSYGRICQQPVRRGDWIAVNDTTGHVMMGQCVSLPGDTVRWQGHTIIVPGKVNCARHDYYGTEQLGLVQEEQIIGRVTFVMYNHQPGTAFWEGYDHGRWLKKCNKGH